MLKQTNFTRYSPHPRPVNWQQKHGEPSNCARANQADCAMLTTEDTRWELYLYVKDNVPMVEVLEVHISGDDIGSPTELTNAIGDWALEDLT
jgi:hypothetical protein